jgi:hypothetical protein
MSFSKFARALATSRHFNPNDYERRDGARQPSCWTYSAAFGSRVAPRQRDSWRLRLAALRDKVAYWIANTPDRAIHVEQLYYDGFA